MPGLYFEEFYVGQEFHHAFSPTVAEMDNTMFSLLTIDFAAASRRRALLGKGRM